MELIDMSDYLNIDIWIPILIICWAFNLVYTAVSNVRKERKQSQEPFTRIDNSLNDLRSRLDLVERRVAVHEDDLKDLHAGQSALCRGVQALLEHELHDGNDEEMRAASDTIGNWLRRLI